jgi:hypothetical protein
MEQAAVDRGIEDLRQVVQMQRVHHQERRVPAALMGLPRCLGDRLLQEVDAGDPLAARGEEESVFASAATDVEQRAGDLVRRLNERVLRFADVPGRLALISFLEPLFAGHLAHGPPLAGSLVQ